MTVTLPSVSSVKSVVPNPAWASLPLFDRTGWKRVRFGDVVENCNETCDPAEAELEERTFAGQGIGYPFQFGAQGRPIGCCFVGEFTDVAGHFGTARGGGDRVPIALLGDQGDQAGQGFHRSAGRQNDTAVEEDSHA